MARAEPAAPDDRPPAVSDDPADDDAAATPEPVEPDQSVEAAAAPASETPPPDSTPDPDELEPDAPVTPTASAAVSMSPRADSDATQPAAASPPAPSVVRGAPTRLMVGVGLAPSAPGSKAERALLDRLEESIAASRDPKAKLRHVPAGAGDPRLVCRERRDDLVVMIGYVANRPEPVVLAHDCRLDRPLGLRSQAAVDEPALLGTLWDEHEELVRQGVRERRTIRRLGPTARGLIIGGVAVAVVGVAIGILVANALRDEKVVITVSP